jgi:YfdX protein
MNRNPTQHHHDRTRFAGTAVALAIASLLAAPLAHSQSATPAAEPAASMAAAEPAAAPETDATANELMKFSDAGNRAIREIRGARVAIFNGDPKSAMELMAGAKNDVAAAEKEAPTFGMTTTLAANGKPVATDSEQAKAISVPVDGQIVLADDFVVTPEKKSSIDKANAAFKQGDRKQAIEELRLAEIDVSYTRLMMPLAPTQKRLASAIKLVHDGKYYEANLALKSIEDGFGVETVALTELPKKTGS